MRKLYVTAAIAVLAASLTSFAVLPWRPAAPDTSLDMLSSDELPLAALNAPMPSGPAPDTF